MEKMDSHEKKDNRQKSWKFWKNGYGRIDNKYKTRKKWSAIRDTNTQTNKPPPLYTRCILGWYPCLIFLIYNLYYY